ncbi:THUMP domain-containing class I SAM-dependent RNA methyltransferase [Desulfatitalea alkaliphila]|uniref:N6-adenine-specific DNA methylase n=1 Tax=Desulfatitalea alkaliphila TaxID=2929485 RepID=A0AA41R6D1_9BACT|nr:hypothetical protein [Desulfatitalea alkaliphila]MCJ8501746.1 hypothetical protein [Desulfatitalea alkaliphila]
MAAVRLDKQIKRHVIAPRHQMLAVTAPGAEKVCAAELAALSDTIRVEGETAGGVAFSGRLIDLYRANLHLRTAVRIWLRVTAFKATNFRQLEKQCAAVAWEHYLPSGCVPQCKAVARGSRLYHTGALAQRAAAAVASRWQAQAVPLSGGSGQTLLIRLEDDRATVSLDSSGEHLYRRGLKTHGARAPLRENLAAAVLRMAGYDPGRPLLDPMCGAGTFSLEAALMAKKVAPGSRRSFAFMQWPAFQPSRWRHLLKMAAMQQRVLSQPLILASDLDETACRQLSACVAANGLADAVRVACRDFFGMVPEVSAGPGAIPGLVVLNPPYGRRLSPAADPLAYYRRLLSKLQRDFRGWDVALLAPDGLLESALPYLLQPFPLVHGGLSLQLLVGRMEDTT